MSKEVSCGDNIRAVGNPSEPRVLTFRVDTTKNLGASSSGKTTLFASSKGNKPLGKSGAYFGLTVFAKTETVSLKGIEGDMEGGTNVMFTADGDDLVLKVELDEKRAQPSSTGKTLLLATSRGVRTVGRTGLGFNLNLYIYANKPFKPEGLMAMFESESTSRKRERGDTKEDAKDDTKDE